MIGANGEMYVSLENANGVGQVIRLIDGSRQIVADALNRPDGLALKGSQLYIPAPDAVGDDARIGP